MEDAYEELVRWYLRFNGYLYIDNFIVHEPCKSSSTVPQGAEVDILAVRFPYSRELVSEKEVVRDLALEPPLPQLIDFVIAEVKGRKKKMRLNKIWRHGDTEPYRGRVEYMVRWLGCFSTEDTISTASSNLLATHHAKACRYSIRVIVFAERPSSQSFPSTVKVITFSEIFQFIVRCRASSFAQAGLGTRSQHSQWSELIKEIWSIAQEETLSENQKFDLMDSLLERVSEERRTSDHTEVSTPREIIT